MQKAGQFMPAPLPAQRSIQPADEGCTAFDPGAEQQWPVAYVPAQGFVGTFPGKQNRDQGFGKARNGQDVEFVAMRQGFIVQPGSFPQQGKDLLRIEVGETSSDRLFSLDVGRCFGACGLANSLVNASWARRTASSNDARYRSTGSADSCSCC